MMSYSCLFTALSVISLHAAPEDSSAPGAKPRLKHGLCKITKIEPQTISDHLRSSQTFSNHLQTYSHLSTVTSQHEVGSSAWTFFSASVLSLEASRWISGWQLRALGQLLADPNKIPSVNFQHQNVPWFSTCSSCSKWQVTSRRDAARCTRSSLTLFVRTGQNLQDNNLCGFNGIQLLQRRNAACTNTCNSIPLICFERSL